MLGGAIKVNSEVDKGSEFEVLIPAKRVETKVKNGIKNILVYDDDPVMLSTINNMLTKLGHRIVAKGYDVILTDMEMGSITGIDILSSAEVPVVLMTGRGDYSVDDARNSGFYDLLRKPVNMDELRRLFGEGDSFFTGFLEEDKEEIMTVFLEATTEKFKLLTTALQNSDFAAAQKLCHKMLPMFVQLNYPTEALRRMDAHKGKEYDGWKTDVKMLLAIEV